MLYTSVDVVLLSQVQLIYQFMTISTYILCIIYGYVYTIILLVHVLLHHKNSSSHKRTAFSDPGWHQTHLHHDVCTSQAFLCLHFSRRGGDAHLARYRCYPGKDNSWRLEKGNREAMNHSEVSNNTIYNDRCIYLDIYETWQRLVGKDSGSVCCSWVYRQLGLVIRLFLPKSLKWRIRPWKMSSVYSPN